MGEPVRQYGSAAREVADFIDSCDGLTVVTGAGCSTPSGIPDYRDTKGEWKRSPPVMYQDFINNIAVRRRYWARSLVGYRYMAAAQYNDAHRALAKLEALGHLGTLITQNVDRLHQAAGSRNVIDLHGRIDRVVCLDCHAVTDRDTLQATLAALNPKLAGSLAAIAPDGDADLADREVADFVVPPCIACGGVLKPDVVFFGESVPKQRVTTARQAVEASDGVLAVGSSLMVFSGFRFVRYAAEQRKPIVVINRGATRADALASAKYELPCEVLLRDVADLLVAA